MRDLLASSLKLPDLKGIRIDNISNTNKDIVRFLSECTPEHLNLLIINFQLNSSCRVKAKFYIDSFSRAAAKTYKEVYFYGIEFMAEDLQTVFNTARNAMMIVFDFCCIHCSSGYNFVADLDYNIEYLSFQQWGHMSSEESDWLDSRPIVLFLHCGHNRQQQTQRQSSDGQHCW